MFRLQETNLSGQGAANLRICDMFRAIVATCSVEINGASTPWDFGVAAGENREFYSLRLEYMTGWRYNVSQPETNPGKNSCCAEV